MGSWFSNLHIRADRGADPDAVCAHLTAHMAARSCIPVRSAAEADCGIAVICGGGWISVYSDAFSFEDPKEFLTLAEPLSGALNADVLGIACFDSDYLYLNLINTAGHLDAWAGVGSARGLGIRRRTGLNAWKNKVSDFPLFQEAVRQKRLFAEEVLSDIEPCLGLPLQRSFCSYEHLEELSDSTRYLYFKLPAAENSADPPRFEQHSWTTMPCAIGELTVVEAVNMGGAGRGLSVFILGPFVEHEELTFLNVSLHHRSKSTPIELKKVRLSDGQWAYHYSDPSFRIPPKVDERLPIRKRMDKIWEESIAVGFIPRGNRRKLLDVTVVLMPEQNPSGQTGWNVWHAHGSKAAFIEDFNRIRRDHPGSQHHLLRVEDFD